MKIFLNDRTIEFSCAPPDMTVSGDLVVGFTTVEKLKESWEEFKRYEKFRRLFIVDIRIGEPCSSGAFNAFASFFKMIPAAGGLVKNEKEEFLFIHRLGFWDLPKGKIDKKDIPAQGLSKLDTQTARAAALREVKEETGLTSVTITRELPVTWHIYFLKEKEILKKTRWFEMKADSSQPLTPETSEGIFLVKWTSPNAIHCIMAHTYASLRELLLEVLF
jgi:8-oxo-dGTP pyrophosphatase MutT (NUDIX family)